MMSTYNQLVETLRQPPEYRLHFQVDHILPWFKKHIGLFRNMKHENMIDLLKNAKLVTKEPDEIIIRQGDEGDCMYIVLRGQVTVYIQYAKNDVDERPQLQPQTSSSVTASEMLRLQLGTFVTPIGPGMPFGEVALLSDQPRTASIITDEKTELLVIDRILYNRSVRDVLRDEFDEKVRFIDESQHLRQMAPRFRKQLAMALQKQSLSYEGVLMRQGDEVDAIYFTLSGELKVTMDPMQHCFQYPKLMRSYYDKMDPLDRLSHFYDDLSARSRPCRSARDSKRRRKQIEICLLGINKPVEDTSCDRK